MRRIQRASFLCAMVVVLGSVCFEAGADTIESRTGVRIEGKVVAQDSSFVTMEVAVGSRTIARKYPVKLIYAVTVNGQKQIINPKPGETPEKTTPPPPQNTSPPPSSAKTPPPSPTATAASTTQASASTSTAGRKIRSRAEVEALIRAAGEEPEWFASTKVEYPPTMDLNWPQPPPTKGWNRNKNVGQYMWDVINPNESRWESGVRFADYLRVRHRTDRSKRERITKTMAGMYFKLLRDYPRAVYWWREAGVRAGDTDAVAMAECYWRMGSKEMAVEMLNQRTLYPSMVKLWGDMGETEKALDVAEQFFRSNVARLQITLLAGDACRTVGRFDEAMAFYQQTLDTPLGSNAKRDKRFHDRAKANLEAMRLFDRADPAKVADGSYRASSLGYVGQVEVEVVVSHGTIKEVRVVKHREKQFYSALNDMPAQIIARQGLKGLDATSRATITAEAIINATAKAMAQGAK